MTVSGNAKISGDDNWITGPVITIDIKLKKAHCEKKTAFSPKAKTARTCRQSTLISATKSGQPSTRRTRNKKLPGSLLVRQFVNGAPADVPGVQ